MQKRHHTIPRCYLEGFTDEQGKVWILDTDNKIYCTKPENILVENHFYRITLNNGEKSVVVEDTLSNIESAYADIYNNKLSQDKSLTDIERAKVAVFFSAMMHRTRPHREGLRRMIEDIKKTAEEWSKKLKTMSDEERQTLAAIPSSGTQISVDDLNKGLKNFDEFHSANLIRQIINTAQIIFDMKWAVWKYDGEDLFVTSDNPLVVMRPNAIRKYGRNTFGSRPGLLFRDAEITLPLSKNRLLLAGWILIEDSYVDVPKNLADGLNQRTILHSSERIVSSSKEVLEKIIKLYPTTNNE